MLKKSMTSTSGIFLLAILALASLGVVYGLWSKNLVINGTVTTGDLNADWDCAWTNDGTEFTGPNCTSGPGQPDGLDPHGSAVGFPYSDPFIEKNVASCVVRIGDPSGEWGDQWAEVLIQNAYPSYECTISFLLSNTGTIPFNIIGINPSLAGNEDGIEFLGCTFPADPQVDPRGEGLVECTIHVLQTAAQSGDPDGLTQSYHFTLNACVAQWNESADFDQCKRSPQHEGPPVIEPAAPTRQ